MTTSWSWPTSACASTPITVTAACLNGKTVDNDSTLEIYARIAVAQAPRAPMSSPLPG